MAAPVWTDSRGAPDELPAFKNPLKVEFPAELKATPDYGYVIYDFVLDEKGKVLGRNPHSTLAILGRVSDSAVDNLRWSAGRREGKNVNTAVKIAVLFNPASASEKGPDGGPRLLEVATARVPQPKGIKESIPDEVVWADVTVDEQGRVTGLACAVPERQKACEVAVKNFRFTPARKEGRPAAATVRLPFIIETSHPATIGANGSMPVVKFQARPTYPFLMRASGLRGEVLVDFIVDIEGRVRNAYVVRTLNPSFDDPALEAVRKWRFEPGSVRGVPVITHMQVPVIFTLDGTRSGGDDGIQITKKADLSKLPEELRYDTPPKLVSMARPVYPYALFREKKEGKATVKMVIGLKGQIVKADVVEASSPEFGQALLTAAERFIYEPALKTGRPCLSLMSFSQQFSFDEGYQLVTEGDLDALKLEQKKPQQIAGLNDLDDRVVPIALPPPKFPLSQSEQNSGEALVEFLIDEDGRVRLPRVVSASREAFGFAAVQGVAAWRFQPPQRGGKPTAVRVRQPITFAMNPAPEAKP